MVISRRSLLLAGVALPAAARAQCVTDTPAVDACWGGVRVTSPPGRTLDLSFMMPGTLPSGVVFTRASTATYFDSTGTMQTAATNAPRWDYNPTTHALNGLLIEEARTNLWLQSADASNAAWGKSGTAGVPAVTGNQVAAPDGTTTAARVVYPAVSGSAYSNISQNPALATNAYSFSVWLKGNAGGERLYLMMTADAVTFNRQQVPLTAAWQRFTATTPSINGGYYCQIGTDLRDAGQTGTPAQTIYVWGGQIEAGAFPTSYIPTTAASVTRAGDTCSMPVASISGFSTTAGSMAHEYAVVGYAPATGAVAQLVGSNVNTDWIDCDQMTTTGATATTPVVAAVASKIAGVAGASATLAAAPIPAGTVHKGASSWAVGAPMHAGHDGASEISTSGTNASLPTLVTLTIGGPVNAQPMVSQWARRTQYWPRQLFTAELQAVTR